MVQGGRTDEQSKVWREFLGNRITAAESVSTFGQMVFVTEERDG
jgi:hypothetical protein